MNSKLPKQDKHEEWKSEAEGAILFGVPIHTLDRDDLLIAIGCLSEMYKAEQIKSRNYLRKMFSR